MVMVGGCEDPPHRQRTGRGFGDPRGLSLPIVSTLLVVACGGGTVESADSTVTTGVVRPAVTSPMSEAETNPPETIASGSLCSGELPPGTGFIRRLEVSELALSVDVWVDKTTVMELKRLTSAVSD